MEYQEVTVLIIDQCRSATLVLSELDKTNKEQDPSTKKHMTDKVTESISKWEEKSAEILEEHELIIELELFSSRQVNIVEKTGWDKTLNNYWLYLNKKRKILLEIVQAIESKKSGIELISITLDDIDNFSAIHAVKPEDVTDYTNSAFLEDDVEECFLEAIGEPYKEADSGSETRDLFTDKLLINGKRLGTAVMFKGRGVKSPLSIDKCGSKGNQLLKLAKNNAAECFIVQHVNKIEPDVKEMLIDSVLTNTRFAKVYVCFIDGVDTARLLRSMRKDLAELKDK
ncbi:hypothetical protein KKH43_01815 [Patescibacteria group bacterium]|nr:hypothetical protein [Patescibacteria group bacterium]